MNITKPKYRKISDLLIHPPKVVKSMFGNFIWNIDSEEKVIYLTFDDGPIPELTSKILKVLNFFDAKATFFCVGENVKKYPKIYNNILKNGHSVGNHTNSHLYGLKTGTEEYLENIEKASEYIDSDLFRPPHGRMKFAQQNEIQKKYKIVLWDVLSFDFDINTSEIDCFNNVKHFTRPGSVIVFHDNIKAEKNMLFSLTHTLEYFSKRGFRFDTIKKGIAKQAVPDIVKVKKRKPAFAAFF